MSLVMFFLKLGKLAKIGNIGKSVEVKLKFFYF